MIISNDTINNETTLSHHRKNCRFRASISEKIGEINATHLYKPATEIRRKIESKLFNRL